MLGRVSWTDEVLGRSKNVPKLTADVGTTIKPPSGNMLSGEGSPCGGLGPALISGFYAGSNAADYLRSI